MFARIVMRQDELAFGRMSVRRVIEGGGEIDVYGGDMRNVWLSRIYLLDHGLE